MSYKIYKYIKILIINVKKLKKKKTTLFYLLTLVYFVA